MKRPIKNGYVMDVILCRRFFPAKRKTLRWAKQRARKDERRQGQREVDGLRWTDLFGSAPDYTGGMDVNEYLDESRGDA